MFFLVLWLNIIDVSYLLLIDLNDSLNSVKNSHEHKHCWMDGGDSFGTVSCMCGVVFGVVLRTSCISARVMFASFLILTSWLIRHLGQSWSCLILTHDTWRRRQALLEEIGPVSHWDTGWRFEHALHL